jgi:hypothetical protein
VHAGPATLFTPAVVIALAAVFVLQWLPERPLGALRERVQGLSPVALGGALAVTIAVVAATVPANAVPPFIYFQF